MKKFYYTFGSAYYFLFKNGWVIIEAESQDEAHEIFRKFFPDLHHNTLNCSFYYNEKKWQEMNPEENWTGWKYFGTWNKDGKVRKEK